MSRYVTVDDTSLDKIVADLIRRVEQLERNPRISSTSIDTGALIVRGGDIIVENADGIEIIRITQSGALGVPEIRFSPLGLATSHILSINADDAVVNGTAQTLGRFEVLDASTSDLDGGFVHIYETGSKIGFSDFGVSEAFAEFAILGAVTDGIRFVGRFGGAFSNIEGVIAGTQAVGAGFGGITIGYPFTMATTPSPIVGLLNSAGALAWCLTAQSNTSFTVSWSGTLAKTINYWSVRM